MAAPGWYQDPWNRYGWRWFDGETWTGSVSPAASPSAADPVPTALRWTGWARTAAAAGVAGAVLTALLLPVMVSEQVSQLRSFFAAARAGVEPATVEPQFSPGMILAGGLSQLLSFAMLAVMVTIAVWSYRMAVAGQSRVRVHPMLVGFSWFIPFASFVLPYVLLWRLGTPGSRARRGVVWWAVLAGAYSAVSVVALVGVVFAGWPAFLLALAPLTNAGAFAVARTTIGHLGEELTRTG